VNVCFTSEALYEDEGFSKRGLAALTASKVKKKAVITLQQPGLTLACRRG